MVTNRRTGEISRSRMSCTLSCAQSPQVSTARVIRATLLRIAPHRHRGHAGSGRSFKENKCVAAETNVVGSPACRRRVC